MVLGMNLSAPVKDLVTKMVAEKLDAEPSRVLHTLRANAVSARRGTAEEERLKRWHQLLREGPTAILDALKADDTDVGWLIDADLLKNVLNVAEIERVIGPSQTDRLVLGTVNASSSKAVTADEIVAWIRSEVADEPKQRVALSTFFLEVPLDTQVAFLVEHDLDEDEVLIFAQRLEYLGRAIPLVRRRRW
jgi:hypothetical protein